MFCCYSNEVLPPFVTTDICFVVYYIQGLPGPVGKMGPKGVRVSRCWKYYIFGINLCY